jgi:hypothetical protein
VNWSAGDVALVPPGVVTVTSTVPVPAGEIAVILVAESTVKLEALLIPNITVVAPVNPVPVTVTVVPPAAGPAIGEMLVTAGTGA